MEYSLYWGLEKAELPLIIVTCINNAGKTQNLCFLIDTGSTNNILFDFVYRHFSEKFQKLDSQGSVIGFEGKEHKTLEVEVSFDFEGANYSSKFSVLDTFSGMRQIQEESGIQIHGVLGLPFLIEYEWTLDFKNLTIRND